MKRSNKRILALSLAVAMVTSIFSGFGVNAHAEDDSPNTVSGNSPIVEPVPQNDGDTGTYETVVNEYFYSSEDEVMSSIGSITDINLDEPLSVKTNITYNEESKDVEVTSAQIKYSDEATGFSANISAIWHSEYNCLYYNNVNETAREMIDGAFNALYQGNTSYSFSKVEIEIYYREKSSVAGCDVVVTDNINGVLNERDHKVFSPAETVTYSPLPDYELSSFTVIADGLDVTSSTTNWYGNRGDISFDASDYSNVSITYNYSTTEYKITVVDEYYILDWVTGDTSKLDHTDTRTVDTYSIGDTYEYTALYTDTEDKGDWYLTGGDDVDLATGKASGTANSDKTITFTYKKVISGVTISLDDRVIAPYADSSLPLYNRPHYTVRRKDVTYNNYAGDFTFTSKKNCIGGEVYLVADDKQTNLDSIEKICDATEVSNGVYELNFHLEDGQGVWAYFYYQGNAYGNGADAPSDWGTDITVIDEYVDSSKETRESIRIEDMNEISLSKSYMPESTKEGYDYNNNLTVTATLEDGEVAVIDYWFEEADSETGSVKFVPEYFDEVTIVYQYEKDDTSEPVEKNYTLTVNDHFDSDVEVRESKVVPQGTVYSYSSLTRDGWKVTGTTSYDGVVNEDTVLDFYYEKEETVSEEEKYTITVNDHFGDDIEVRVKETVSSGTEYSYKALSRDGWKATGITSYDGVVNKDVVLDFYYEKKTTTPKNKPTPEPTPAPAPTPVPDPEPTPTSSTSSTPTITSTAVIVSEEPVLDEEPKTGDTTSSVPLIASVTVLFGAILNKKRKTNK